MNTATRILSKSIEFRSWLSGCGAEVLEPTNEWELIRFKSEGATSVIYRNSVGGVTYTGKAEEAYKAFKEGKPWRAKAPTRRKKMSPKIRTVRQRDGDLCFYCQKFVSEDNESAEHLVSVTHGGPMHISNIFLAHKGCNARAGHLSAPEKIKVHVQAVIERNNKLREES